MHWVYIIQSIKNKRYYVGSTSNLEERITRHNNGGSVWTSHYKPWELIYSEKHTDRKTAMKREKEIKSWKSGSKFREFIQNI